MLEHLKQWICDNHLSVTFLSENVLEIEGAGKFLIVSQKDRVLDERLILNLTDEEINQLDDVDYLLFMFGSFWFYQHKDDESNKLTFFRYLGTSNVESIDVPFLGVHGKYELCNGSRDYSDWVKKVKFLGYSSIGLCEHQTLAGSYYFQQACNKGGLKAIHGRTNKIQSRVGSYYYIKSYAKTEKGWKNLLKIHNTEMITRGTTGQYVTEEELSSWSEDLVHIFCHETDLDQVNLSVYDLNNTFFQFNIIEYTNNAKDKEHLLNLKKYLTLYKDQVKPLVMQDGYYLDKGDDIIKPFLNKISNYRKDFRSTEEYVKPFEEILNNLVQLFVDERLLEFVIDSTFEIYNKIDTECTFVLDKTGMHLPRYKMNPDEAALYSSNEEMFFALIEKGFEEKIANKVNGQEEEYLDRLEKEIAVLQEGNVIDYFLILYDVFNYMKRETGVVSLGRGSSAGSLVSFVLGIVQIDPIKYDLLFERFLNKARLLSGSLPDIDSDIPSSFRQNVIDYLINKYGRENVACIGTAQNLQLKSALRDYMRVQGYNVSEINLISSFITAEDNLYNFDRLLKVALEEPKIKELIHKYPDMLYIIYLCIFQPRSFGIHAAGVVIFPDSDEEGNKLTAADFVPLRLSGDQYVTEWEKGEIENHGLLKADLLGLAQLDKIRRMNELILQGGKQYQDFLDIDLQDPKVLRLFKEAITEDVFQFNTDVQKGYLLQLNPESIEDLIAANALNRPGAMESNSHIDFIKIKNGDKQEEKLPLIEDLLDNTRSLLVYQEQVMFAYQRLTNCDLNETDNFRKVISKSKPGKLDPKIEQYKENFLKGYQEKGVDENKAREVWDKIIGFTSYSFNRSHAAAYAITGYWAAYYKAYFPVEFYTCSLEAASGHSRNKELLPRLINEINASKLITLSHPDINKSEQRYSIDVQENTIYWSLLSVSYAGEKIVDNILQERQKNGAYFSLEEFVLRSKGSRVNKKVVTHLILAGCFDKIENIKEEKDRLKLLIEYYTNILKEPVPVDIATHRHVNKNHFWIMQQRKVCGLGDIDYENIYKEQKMTHWLLTPYCDGYLLQDNSSLDRNVVVGGLLEEIIERTTRNGKLVVQLRLNSNNQPIFITVWDDVYVLHKEVLKANINEPIFVSGIVKHDLYKKTNTIQTNGNTKIIGM